MSPLVVSAFALGIVGGAHCVAMCGGVASLLGSAAPGGARYVVAYNAGRVLSYTVLGAAASALGTLSSDFDAARFLLRALAAVCMLVVGLHLVGLPTPAKTLESLGAPLWRRIAPVAKRLLPLRSPLHAIALGAVWGLMPCGMIYAALALAASAQSPSLGAATMAAFGVATLPVMLGAFAAARTVGARVANGWVRRGAGIVVLGLGVYASAGVASQLHLGAKPHACCPHR